MQSHAWLTYECSRTSVSCLNAPLHPPPPSKVSFYSLGGFLKCNARKVSLPCAEKGKMLVEPPHPLGTLISLGPHLLAQKGPSGPQNEIWVSALSETQEPLICLPCVSVQSLSHVRLFATLWTAAQRGTLSITNSQSLKKLMPIEYGMPSNHLILCCLLLLPPSIFPSIRVFSKWVSSSREVAKVLEFQLQHKSFQWTPRTNLV